MHLIVSWDINNQPDPGAWSMWNERLKETIKKYAWVRPLNNLYVVPVFNELDRQNIIRELTAVSQQSNGQILFIVSPAMVGGQYGGVLPQNLWPELNTRSA